MDETKTEYTRRAIAMSDADLSTAGRVLEIQQYRATLKKVIDALADGEFPRVVGGSIHSGNRASEIAAILPDDLTDQALPVTALIFEFAHRYGVAWRKARADWLEAKRQTPIDDAAWQAELDRRADIERQDALLEARMRAAGVNSK
jgi:hypothetical protein